MKKNYVAFFAEKKKSNSKNVEFLKKSIRISSNKQKSNKLNDNVKNATSAIKKIANKRCMKTHNMKKKFDGENLIKKNQ